MIGREGVAVELMSVLDILSGMNLYGSSPLVGAEGVLWSLAGTSFKKIQIFHVIQNHPKSDAILIHIR